MITEAQFENYDEDEENEQEQSEDEEDSIIVKDSNGTRLNNGDSVTVIKDLKVKGSSMVVKRGTLVKNIRLTHDDEHVDCKVNGSQIVLKTCFLKKS